MYSHLFPHEAPVKVSYGHQLNFCTIQMTENNSSSFSLRPRVADTVGVDTADRRTLHTTSQATGFLLTTAPTRPAAATIRAANITGTAVRALHLRRVSFMGGLETSSGEKRNKRSIAREVDLKTRGAVRQNSLEGCGRGQNHHRLPTAETAAQRLRARAPRPLARPQPTSTHTGLSPNDALVGQGKSESVCSLCDPPPRTKVSSRGLCCSLRSLQPLTPRRSFPLV